MTDSTAVLEDGHSEGVGVMNVMALELKWQLSNLADIHVGRPRMMTTNSTGDRLYFCNCEHEP